MNKINLTIQLTEEELSRLSLLAVDFSTESISSDEYAEGIIRQHLDAKFTTSTSHSGSRLFEELLNLANRLGSITITAELMNEIRHQLMEYHLSLVLQPKKK